MNRIQYKNKYGKYINYIKVAPGITAMEGTAGSMPSLTIRKHGKKIYYRGSSLYFSKNLTAEDCDYLKSLAKI
jgi:hypothetical protein